MEKKIDNKISYNLQKEGDSDSNSSDEAVEYTLSEDLGNYQIADPSSEVEDFGEDLEDPQKSVKKRPVVSSGSESGSVTKENRQELKKFRKAERFAQFERNCEIPIVESQPGKPGPSKPLNKPVQPKTPAPAKVPAVKPVVSQPKATQERLKNQQKKKDEERMSQGSSGMGGNKPRPDEVYEYEVEEMNTEKDSLTNLCSQPSVVAVFADLVKKDNIHKLQSFLLSGKRFSDSIKSARSDRKKFIRYSNILINIQLDPKSVTITDFTKQRFLAACHVQLYESGLAKEFCSPLVTRINFSPSNPLTAIKPL